MENNKQPYNMFFAFVFLFSKYTTTLVSKYIFFKKKLNKIKQNKSKTKIILKDP